MKPIIEQKVIDKLNRLVNGVSDILITCHISPDGDAIGSTLALCRLLRRMGKTADVLLPDMLPRSLNFVPTSREASVFTQSEARAQLLVSRAQLIFCLDFNSLKRIDRLGALLETSKAPRVLIDHHLNPDDIFDVVVSFPQMSSTCELVYHVANDAGWLPFMDKTVAQCLYVGMTTDTGNFTYSSEYPEVYEVLAQLVAYKIDKQRLYNLAMNTFSESSLRIQGYAMSQKMQLFADKGVALITLTRPELEQYKYHRGDTEGLVNKPLTIPGISMSVFLREDPEYIKVSCRSEGDISVNDMCVKYFNGGGHKNAAGGEVRGTMDEAVTLFMKAIEEINPNTENKKQQKI